MVKRRTVVGSIELKNSTFTRSSRSRRWEWKRTLTNRNFPRTLKRQFRFSRNNKTVIIFTSLSFAFLPHNWPALLLIVTMYIQLLMERVVGESQSVCFVGNRAAGWQLFSVSYHNGFSWTIDSPFTTLLNPSLSLSLYIYLSIYLPIHTTLGRHSLTNSRVREKDEKRTKFHRGES